MRGKAWPGWVALGVGFVWLMVMWDEPPTAAPVPGSNWGEQALLELAICLTVMGCVVAWRRSRR